MADQEAERSQQIAGTAPTISRANAIVALAVCFVGGYFLAEWGAPKTRDRSPIAQICARVDYVNSLQENLEGQDAASEEVRAEFKALVEQCHVALRETVRNPAEDNSD